MIQRDPRVRLFRTDKSAVDFLSFNGAERLTNAAELEWQTLILAGFLGMEAAGIEAV